MNKHILLLLGLLFVVCLSAEVQDLPDIEISGPSPLKSTLEKKNLLRSELYIADVTDSLNPIFPVIKPTLPPVIKQKNLAAYLDLSNLGANTFFNMNNVLKENGFASGSAKYYIPKRKWQQFNGELSLLSELETSTLGLIIRNTNNTTPKNIKYQSDTSLRVTYDLDALNSSELPIEMKLSTDIHLYKDKKLTPASKCTSYYLNGNLELKYQILANQMVGLDIGFNQKTPSVTLQLLNTAEDEKLDFIKSISITGTDKRIVPGIYLAKRIEPLPQTSLLLYQESEVNIWDTYSLIHEQPWQYRQKKAIVAITPLNSHLVVDNKSFALKHTPIVLSGDLGIQYVVDEPILISNGLANDLPIAMPEGILSSNLNLGAKVSTDSLSFSQSIKLNKGWLSAHSYINQPYLPLISAESRLEYNYGKFAFTALLNQYYHTQDEGSNFLREAIMPGVKVDYTFRQNVTVYGKLSSLLNKGKYVYRTLPTEPASVLLGCMIVF